MKPEIIIKPPPNNSANGTIEAEAGENPYRSIIPTEGIGNFW
jgi:hypothetical protein